MSSALLLVVHVIGIALGAGAATAKLLLLLRARDDPAFVPHYIAVLKPITSLIVAGIVLLTLSGVTWLILGFPLTSRLITKLVLVAAIWLIGPIVDRLVEPKFCLLALAPDAATSPAFIRVRRQYLTLETIATLLFYAVIVYWVLG